MFLILKNTLVFQTTLKEETYLITKPKPEPLSIFLTDLDSSLNAPVHCLPSVILMWSPQQSYYS